MPHAVPQVDDLVPVGARLDRLHGGGHVLEQVAVQVPFPVEVAGERAALLPAQLDLQLPRAAAMAAQLGDVAIRARHQEPLHERRAGECVPVLRPPGDQQQRLAQDGLLPLLLERPVPGDLQHPPIPGARVVNLLAIQRLELDLVERRGVGVAKPVHVPGRRPGPAVPAGPSSGPPKNLGARSRHGKNVHNRSLGIRPGAPPRRPLPRRRGRATRSRRRTRPDRTPPARPAGPRPRSGTRRTPLPARGPPRRAVPALPRAESRPHTGASGRRSAAARAAWPRGLCRSSRRRRAAPAVPRPVPAARAPAPARRADCARRPAAPAAGAPPSPGDPATARTVAPPGHARARPADPSPPPPAGGRTPAPRSPAGGDPGALAPPTSTPPPRPRFPRPPPPPRPAR